LEEKPHLHPLLDAFAEAVCLLDEDGTVRCINAAAERLLGYREDELLGRPLLSDLEVAQEGGAAAAFDRLSPFRQESTRFRRKDGSVLVVVCAVHPLGQDDAGPTLLKFRERAREPTCNAALRDIEAKLKAIFDAISDGIIIIDESGAIQLFTSGAEHLFGYHHNEVLGQNVKMLMPPPSRESHDSYLATYLRTGVKKIVGTGREVSGQRKNGTVFPMYLSVGEMHLDGCRLFVGIIHDLTQRKRSEEQLLTLSSAVDQSPAAVLIAALDGQIEYVNRSFTHLTGYAVDELIGHSPRLLQSGHSVQERSRLWETIQRGREWRGEIQDRKKNGEFYWALETVTPLRNAQEEITHYLVIQQDITEQKQDKDALAESEARFRHVAAMAGEWLWEQDPEGRYLYSSSAVRDILGFAPLEIRGKHYLDLLTAEDRKHWTAAADIRQPFHRLVNRYRHKDGHEVYTESTGAPIFDEQGKLTKWRGVDHDITARKAFEDALRVRDRAIEATHVGIVIAGASHGNPNIYVNPALSRITGYSREELLCQNMRMLQGPDTDPAAVEQIRQAVNSGRSCEVVLKNYRKDGTAFWNELLISPVHDDTGKLTHFIGIQTDVTERRRAEESRHELEIAKHIQLSLLPDSPLVLPTAELAGVCVPASHVGGDYFDFFHTSDAVDVVIADVSGHSVGAALIMAEVRSTLRAETRKAAGIPVGPAQVLRDLNELLYDDLTRAELFITMFYLKYLPDTRMLKYANAGHNKALLLQVDDVTCTALDAEGLVLGVRREVDFEERSVGLAAGDRLLLYTDGVTEAENQHGAFFGVAHLGALFTTYRTLPPEALIGALLAEVRAFCGETPIRDDISMLLLQVR
jgi:sigma-B regulation protein RsbU (phosphoserine phosphatase)